MNPTAFKDLPRRIASARDLLLECRLCPRDCRANRLADQRGFCGLGGQARWFREFLYSGEEAELAPTHQVQFSGCNLRCEYCVVSEWNEQVEAGKLLDIKELAAIIRRRQAAGARTLSLLGGEPALNLPGILELLANLSPEIPVVWNSNFYFRPVVLELLDGLIDVWLPDYKCGNSLCAKELLGADDYLEVVRENLLRVGGVEHLIIRHVILPGHRECCLEPILEWIAFRLPQARVSLWSAYVPPPGEGSAPRGYLKAEEYRDAIRLAEKMKIRLVH